MARKKLPIGIDDFSEIRAKDYYFVDKSLMIRDFLEMGDKVALVARPRRFGKTLNMTMLREFLDITRDSSGLFQGLAIMDTEYAACINSRPVLLIDEYDQPIMSSYEYGYHEKLGTFFTNLYGMAMKGNDALDQALLTGVQRVVKESIFSQFNNPKVYTVFNRQYASSFGLTEEETGEPVQVWLTLDTSYAERDSDASLWGLFVNAGYLTVIKRMDADSAVVRIPNEEVMSEFRNLVSE